MSVTTRDLLIAVAQLLHDRGAVTWSGPAAPVVDTAPGPPPVTLVTLPEHPDRVVSLWPVGQPRPSGVGDAPDWWVQIQIRSRGLPGDSMSPWAALDAAREALDLSDGVPLAGGLHMARCDVASSAPLGPDPAGRDEAVLTMSMIVHRPTA